MDSNWISRLALAAVALFLASCAASCASVNPCTGDPSVDLLHDDPKCRMNAAVIASEKKRYDLLPLLIENLRHRSGDVRLITGVAMRRLTGLDAGFRSYSSLAERDRAIEKWKDWWDAYRRGRQPATATGAPVADERDRHDDQRRRTPARAPAQRDDRHEAREAMSRP